MKRPVLNKAKDPNDRNDRPRGHLFEKGMKKPEGSGRKPGQQNRTTTALKEAILLAAAKVGYDGEGEDGLVGYLRMLALSFPKSYASLLGRVLPYQINANVNDKRELRTPEEVAAEIRARGLPPMDVTKLFH